MVNVLLIGGVIVVILIIIGIVVSVTSERSLVEDRLGRYLEDEGADVGEQAKVTDVARDWLNKQVSRSSFGDNLSKSLSRADMKFKPGEFMLLVLAMIVGVGGLAFLIGNRHILSLLIGGLAGAVLPFMYLNTQQGRRLKRFNDQLPDMINLMVNGLRAGYSTMQAMEAVSKELPAPLSEEFRRVVQEMQLGVPMERSLDNLLRRIPSEDLDFVITAINVQREVGGPLAEILDTISFTIRERIRIKGEIRTLVAQVIMSGRILSGVPFALAVLLWFINQEYMMEFANNPLCGGIAAGLGIVMIGIGYFIMTRIADIEV